jgi:HK97 family phage prohead protease
MFLDELATEPAPAPPPRVTTPPARPRPAPARRPAARLQQRRAPVPEHYKGLVAAFEARRRWLKGRTYIDGYAALFNSPSRPFPDGHVEVIREGAFAFALALGGTVLLTLDHRRAKPLAQTGGGQLCLKETPDGLYFKWYVNDSHFAQVALAVVESGGARGMSFSFSREGTEAALVRLPGGERAVCLTQVALTEVSIMMDAEPQYADAGLLRVVRPK